MDEKNIQMGSSHKNNQKKYFFLQDCHDHDCDYNHIHSNNLELFTVLECISAAGVTAPPAFVLSDGPLPDLHDLPENSIGRWDCFFSLSTALSYVFHLLRIMTLPMGWTDHKLCEQWFKDIFIPFADSKCVCQDKPIVLNLNGHESHETFATKCLGQHHNVIIICFPSKCTHKLQPINMVVFSSVQRAWSSHCEQRLAKVLLWTDTMSSPNIWRFDMLLHWNWWKRPSQRQESIPLILQYSQMRTLPQAEPLQLLPIFCHHTQMRSCLPLQLLTQIMSTIVTWILIMTPLDTVVSPPPGD